MCSVVVVIPREIAFRIGLVLALCSCTHVHDVIRMGLLAVY